MSFKFEVCCYNYQSVLNALKAGADRIELCDNYCCGGTTPSFGLIKRVREIAYIPLFIMIRPRCGGFIYSKEEIEIMRSDIIQARKLNVDGIVIGQLNQDNSIDLENTKRLMDAAGNLSVTFHKAFDLIKEPMAAIEELIQLGVDRILTSGQASTAFEGKEKIYQSIKKANNRINIMPGGNINKNNILEIATVTKANEFHFSAKKLITDPDLPDEYKTTVISDTKMIRETIRVLRTD